MSEITSNSSLPYEPISNLPSTGGVISAMLLEGFEKSRDNFLLKHPEGIDIYVAKLLDITLTELENRLSAEQVDAVGLAWFGFEEFPSRSIVIADETGYGKGRIMSYLAIICCNQQLPVVFVTEKPNLFQDFYRDLVAVCGGDEDKTIVPTPMHIKGKIVSQEKTTLKGKPIVIAKPLKSGEKPNRDDNPIICTTYSQLRDEDRINAISEYMGKDGILLLDEAHQSMGQSKVGKAIQYLIRNALWTGYASATYAWLGSHLKPLAPVLTFITPAFIPLLVKAVDMDKDGSLRSSIAEQMAMAGTLLRREHPPAPPSEIKILPQTDFQVQTMDALMELAEYHLYLCENNLARKDLWKTFGKWIPQVLRQVGVWLKMDGVINEIVDTLVDNKKAVVVVDSTLSESEELADEDEEGNLTGFWRETLKPMVPIEGEDKQLWDTMVNKLPDWHGSPLDVIVKKLEERGIKNVLEISGRVNSVKRKPIINAFNKGESDVIILTRAGSTGISLHASAVFKDQRIRRMITWDASNQSAVGKQFKGRVRRRDQVCEPEYVEIVLDTPYERKRADREFKKLELLNAQASGREVNLESIPIESKYGQFIFQGWIKKNRNLAYKLGLFGADRHPAGLGTIHKALLRLPLIGLLESQEIFANVENFLDEVQTSFKSWYRQNIKLTEAEVVRPYYATGTAYEISIGKYTTNHELLTAEEIYTLKDKALAYQAERPATFHTWSTGSLAMVKHPDTGKAQLCLLLSIADDEEDETAFCHLLFTGDPDIRKVPYELIKGTVDVVSRTMDEFLTLYLNERPPLFALDGPLWLIHVMGEWMGAGRMIYDENSHTHKWLLPYGVLGKIVKKPWLPLINPSHVAYWLDHGQIISTPDMMEKPQLQLFRMDDGIHVRVTAKVLEKLVNNGGFFGYIVKYRLGEASKGAQAFHSKDPACVHSGDGNADLVIRYPSKEMAKGTFEMFAWGLSVLVDEGSKYEDNGLWEKFNDTLRRVIG